MGIPGFTIAARFVAALESGGQPLEEYRALVRWQNAGGGYDDVMLLV